MLTEKQDMLKNWADEVWEKIEKKMEIVAERTVGMIPYTARNGIYAERGEGIHSWTNGFWPGWMWLLYLSSKKTVFRERAEQAEKMLDAALFDYDGLSHDVGFIWGLSALADYRITGNTDSRNRALLAAATLASRFNNGGQFIRAWNPEERAGWTIVDTMMNLPLLYWASTEKKDPRFEMIARTQADMTMVDHVREDGSVRHIVVHDPQNGHRLEELGGQGVGVGSAWSRGQAWGLYGFVLSHLYTGEECYLNTAKLIANYFLASCADSGYVPLVDFRAPQEPVVYDTTAGAIAACGLIEMAQILPENEARLYRNGAEKILKALEAHCDFDPSRDSILQDGSERYAGEKTEQIPIVYGDFYFTEALYKLRGFTLRLE